MSEKKVSQSNLRKENGSNLNAKNQPILVSVLPNELVNEMGQVFSEFIAKNGEVKGSLARRMNFNMQSIKRNAEAYAKKEFAFIKENVEFRDDTALFWDGEHTEDVYLPTLPEDADKEPILIAGLVVQKPIKEHPGWGFFNEKGEQLLLRPETPKIKFYIKDETKRESFSQELKELTETPVELLLHMFAQEELDELMIPTTDLEKFYKNFGHE